MVIKKIQHKNFHTLKSIKAGEKQVYILKKWKVSKDLYIIGASIGLLCLKNSYSEIYLAISKNPQLNPKRYFIGLKKDYLFYQQRDVYTYSSGIKDLVDYQFLPAGSGFFIKKGETIYIKVGAINLEEKPLKYDAFCNIYYHESQDSN